MPNRENVIKGLIDIGGFIAGRVGFEQARNFLRTIDDALAMLKEQQQQIWEIQDQVEYLTDKLKEHEAVEPRVSTAEQRCGHCKKVIEMDGWKACP